jgi:hypothetical protein
MRAFYASLSQKKTPVSLWRDRRFEIRWKTK